MRNPWADTFHLVAPYRGGHDFGGCSALNRASASRTKLCTSFSQDLIFTFPGGIADSPHPTCKIFHFFVVIGVLYRVHGQEKGIEDARCRPQIGRKAAVLPKGYGALRGQIAIRPGMDLTKPIRPVAKQDRKERRGRSR